MENPTENSINESNTHPKEMTFFDHLEELRWHIFRSVVALLLFAIVAFLFKKFIFDIVLLSPKEPWFITNRLLCQLGDLLDKSILCINQNELKLININIAGQFLMHIKISMIAGFIASFPYIIYEVWLFIKPALYPKEKKIASHTILAVSLLFFIGVLIGYFIIVPLFMNFLSNYSISESVDNTINLSSYISNISSICFASGIMFELPVFSFFLSKLGVISPQFMKRYRRFAWIIILILSAILTPPDVFSQILIALPLFLLYEISIKISANVAKNKTN